MKQLHLTYKIETNSGCIVDNEKLKILIETSILNYGGTFLHSQIEKLETNSNLINFTLKPNTKSQLDIHVAMFLVSKYRNDFCQIYKIN